jgi:hypothetical protein
MHGKYYSRREDGSLGGSEQKGPLRVKRRIFLFASSEKRKMVLNISVFSRLLIMQIRILILLTRDVITCKPT